jgi:hypothetical protein
MSSSLALRVHGRMKDSRSPLIWTLVIQINNYPFYKVQIVLHAADKETISQAWVIPTMIGEKMK